ncbi:thymidylate synthase [Micromonospora ureilytica]|uniref:thymidylate synthase n=1 Tax=Micromonospora ureilytica TaxID=709868 RepID=UPI0033C9C150
MFLTDTLVCGSLAEAIPRVLALVRQRGRPAIVRGEVNLEVLCADIVITDPTDRLPIVAGRRKVVAFCIAEFLWYCAQQTDLHLLETYAPNIRSFYGGQRFVTGSNYGAQVFGARAEGSQWAKVVALLGQDPGSKRAFIAVYSADGMGSLLPENHDVACTLGFHILVRDGHLHWITSMRANDAYRGFVSDTFSFTLLHELLAATVGIPVGHYLHRVNSLHTFPEDEPAIDRIIQAAEQGVPTGSATRMPPLRPEELWRHVDDFWTIHEKARAIGNWQLLQSLRDLRSPWWEWAGDILLEYHGAGASGSR